MRAALAPNGHAVLSGILSTERDAMLSAVSRDWRVVDEDSEDVWWSATIAPR
jgi:ribosomal protein L11 methylase PrmA